MESCTEICENKIDKKELVEVANFLSDFANTLMMSGTQTSRVAKNVKRLAKNFGFKINMIILPQTIIMTISAREHSYTELTKIDHSAPDFTKISKLRILSWEAYKNHWSLEKCREEFAEIKKSSRFGWKQSALIVSTGNAALCQLFGGFYSIPIVFVATLLGYISRRFLNLRGISGIISTMVAAFASASFAGFCSEIFEFKTDICMSTSVLYLIPGVPLLNSFVDLFDGHILAGLSRLVQALETILAITLGFLGAIIILGHTSL